MLYFTEKKGDCTGCSACVTACPVKCISMQTDEEGFWYPVASDACIHCGKCQKVCPIEKKDNLVKSSYSPKAFCAVTKDKKVWQRSASGGAFSEICRAFGDEETIVCGAVWDGLNVKHICVKGVENIAALCKSKYVASSPESVFSEIRDYLKDEKKVIFCGTPCQVAGLKSVLGKSYDNLLLIDLICHGVGSPKVFQTTVQVIGKELGENLISYEFRSKGKVFSTDYLQKVTTADNRSIYLTNDRYIQLFLSQNSLRPSCGGNCRFRNEERQGDITIADFKGLNKVFPDTVGTKKNYSSVIINSPKGEQLISKLQKNMEIRSCDIQAIKDYNPLFYRQTWESKDREAFFEDFIQSPEDSISKWTKPSRLYKDSIKHKIWDKLPIFARRIIQTKINNRKH